MENNIEDPTSVLAASATEYLTKSPQTYTEVRTAPSTNGAEQTDVHTQKNEIRLIYITLHSN